MTFKILDWMQHIHSQSHTKMICFTSTGLGKKTNDMGMNSNEIKRTTTEMRTTTTQMQKKAPISVLSARLRSGRGNTNWPKDLTTVHIRVDSSGSFKYGAGGQRVRSQHFQFLDPGKGYPWG